MNIDGCARVFLDISIQWIEFTNNINRNIFVIETAHISPSLFLSEISSLLKRQVDNDTTAAAGAATTETTTATKSQVDNN